MTTEERLDQLEIDAMGLRRLVNDQEARLAIANQRHDDGAGHDKCLTWDDYEGCFDLYDITDTTCKVRGFDTVTDKLACIAGVHVQITGGAEELDTAITISADTYIYVNGKRSDNTATLETSGTFDDGDDDEERFYLWFVPWDAGNSKINRNAIKKLRGIVRWTAGA